jgi:hypothetical protein
VGRGVGFSGVFSSPVGLMVLLEKPGREVLGCYAFGDGSRIRGRYYGANLNAW